MPRFIYIFILLLVTPLLYGNSLSIPQKDLLFSLDDLSPVTQKQWQKMDLGNIRFFTNRTFWIKAELPGSVPAQSELLLISTFDHVHFYIGTNELKSKQAGRFEKGVNLPDYAPGLPLYMQVEWKDFSSLRLIALKIIDASQTEYHDRYSDIIMRGSYDLVCGVIFLLLGAVSLLTWLLRRGKKDTILLSFFLFSTTIGLKFVLSSDITILNSGNNPVLYNINEVSFLFFPAFFTLFISRQFGRGWITKFMDFLWKINLILAIPIAILFILRTGFQIYTIFTLGLALEFFVSMLALLDTIRSMKKDHRFVLLLTSLLSLIISFFIGFFGVPAYIFILPYFYFFGVLFYMTIDSLSARDRELIAIQEELSVAKRIQMSIIPAVKPKFEGIAFGSIYIPMTSVAGDIYDYAVINGHQIGILIADVSGHGVPAAMIASMIKVSYHSCSLHFARSGALLSSLNTILSGRMESQFVTAGYCVLDRSAMTLCYSSAAHPPLILQDRESGEMQFLKPRGTVIGYFPDQVFGEETVKIRSGTRVILYTDGITETENADGEEFGEQQFRQFIADHRDADPDVFLAELITTLQTWNREDSFQDDITAVVLDVL